MRRFSPGGDFGRCRLSRQSILNDLMADIFSKQQRSAVMAAVRSKGNKATELKLILILREHGIKGWRRQHRGVGKPDFVFPKYKLAIFVDGCFWHGCRRHFRMPQENRKYWKNKILRNSQRDRATTRFLRRGGWRVVRLWEHSLKDTNLVARKIKYELSTAEQLRKIHVQDHER